MSNVGERRKTRPATQLDVRQNDLDEETIILPRGKVLNFYPHNSASQRSESIGSISKLKTHLQGSGEDYSQDIPKQ